MEPFSLHPAFYNRPIRLGAEETTDPQQVLQDFFQTCPLAEIRRVLAQTIEAALSLPYSPFDAAGERQSLLWLHRHIEEVLEAAWLLSAHQQPE